MRLTDRDRLLIQDTWNDVFHRYDGEPDVTGEFAGRLAQAAADAVELVLADGMHDRDVMTRHMMRTVADSTYEQLAGRLVADGADEDSSQYDIEKILSPCVCGPMLIGISRSFPEEVNRHVRRLLKSDDG